jgi:hypothetical protein
MVVEFTKGMEIEVCPYPAGHKVSFAYLGNIDGEVGQVVGTKGYGEEMFVLARFAFTNGVVAIPARAVKQRTPPTDKED